MHQKFMHGFFAMRKERNNPKNDAGVCIGFMHRGFFNFESEFTREFMQRDRTEILPAGAALMLTGVRVVFGRALLRTVPLDSESWL